MSHKSHYYKKSDIVDDFLDTIQYLEGSEIYFIPRFSAEIPYYQKNSELYYRVNLFGKIGGFEAILNRIR